MNSYLSVVALALLACAPGLAADRYVQVDGGRIHVVEQGSGPNVVFEAGVGEDVQTWASVAPAISGFAHIFLYDRAGLGKSDATSRPRTIQQLSDDLHAVLRAADARPPYVLVGHSLGGAIIQVFGHDHPSEIAGLVFLDPEDGRLVARLHAALSPEVWKARTLSLGDMRAHMSAAQLAELDRAIGDEAGVAKALPLPRVPTILFSGTQKNPEFPGNPTEQDLKLELQHELLRQLPGAQQVLVPNSRHYIQEDAPQLVIDAVKKMIQGV
jgi:pimeloyl-ACP methyl ester carboxylesterase